MVWYSDTNAPTYNLHIYLQFVPFDLLINKNNSGTINSDLPICKKNESYDPEIGTADNKNALETPFFAILNPKKGLGGFIIDI